MNTQKHRELLNKGFTLIELMVVVAIIGILAAIAIPNYSKYQAKARQTEAKLALSSIYTAESSFYTENATYTLCLSNIGYAPIGFTGGTAGTGVKSYYATGFGSTASGSTCGPTGGIQCYAYSNLTNATPTTCGTAPTNGTTYFNAGLKMSIGNPAVLSNLPTTNKINQLAFEAGAAGSISNTTTYDLWTIDQNNTLINPTVGY